MDPLNERLQHLKEMEVLQKSFPKIFRAVPFEDRDVTNLSPDTKLVYLVRHGQGYHNLAAIERGHGCTCRFGVPQDEPPCPYINEELVDPHLTEKGHEEARRGAESLATRDARMADVVFVSPLTRTLQTANLVFPSHPRVTAVEHLREQLGLHHCDRRSSIADVVPRFPHVDFSRITNNDDALWSPQRETKAELAARAQQAMREVFELAGAHASHLGVVSHSSFLAALLNVVVDTSAVAEAAAPFATGEVRPVLLQLSTTPDTVHRPLPPARSADGDEGVQYRERGGGENARGESLEELEREGGL